MKRALCLLLLAVGILMAGCAAAPVRQEPEIPARRPVSEYVKEGQDYVVDAYDPWEPMNRRIYNFNAIFDEYVFLPVVRAYETILPDFAQTGISNFFNNLTEISNLMNSLLQFKIEKALSTFGRLAVNSTVGLGGLIDVATHDGIKRENEDFGQTLGFYGIGPGPYLVLPLMGPSDLRDTAGLVTDSVVYSLMMSQLIAELGMQDDKETILNYSLTGLYVVDKRHSQSFRYFTTGSPFEYELIRKLYLLQRQFLVDN